MLFVKFCEAIALVLSKDDVSVSNIFCCDSTVFAIAVFILFVIVELSDDTDDDSLIVTV